MAQLQSSSSNHKKIEKCRAELKRLQMCRLKQSQNVPLIIKEIDTQTVYHFRKMFILENTLFKMIYSRLANGDPRGTVSVRVECISRK